MSLATTPAKPLHQWRLGIVAAKDFDSRDFLEDLIGGNLGAISHVYTNGANQLVVDFAIANGLPITIYPIAGGRGLPASTCDILANSDFVYIIATPESKSAATIKAGCEARKLRHKLVSYESITHWREKVGKVAEILAAMPEEERQANEWAEAIWRTL